MPRFIFQRWYGYHMVFAMCFSLILTAIISIYNWIIGIFGLAVFFILALVLYRAEQAFRKDFNQYLLTLTHRIKNAGQSVLDEMPIGVLLYDRDGQIEWHNRYVQEILNRSRLIGEPLRDVFPELKQVKNQDEKALQIRLGERSFELIHQAEERLYFIRDITDFVRLKEKYEDEQVVLGFLHLDNLDDVEQGLSDQETTLLLSNVWSEISSWAEEYEMTVKRLDTDRMFFVTEQKALNKLVKSRFDILDVVRDMTRQYKIPLTLSIGVASVGNNMIERSRNAQAALEIALARGGDQAAVQNKERIVFFGGKTNAVEKRTRVRARVISHAMRNLIRDSNRVLVMGHKDPDMDALGAAIGVVKFALINDCEAYIVLDDKNSSIDRLMKVVYEHDYLGDHLIHSEKALQWIDDPDTLLVLVDTHKPSLAIEPRLLERAERIVVIDHHRRGEDFVDDAVLVYLEPYASSTCELVTELLQYHESRLAMDPLEATALLAGIVVDTKNFAVRAGSRTFEAASFLRRHGADLTMVQSLLKEDLDRFIKRAEIIKNTELYHETIAIAVGDENESYDQVLIAQTADTLLNMQGIRASFVICKREDGLISISARSHGDLNVQVIMEQMGGGGHLSNAACQIKSQKLKEVKEQLLRILKETLESGGK
ncbi:DHH family phosphoesterase [Thermoflavimicrobium dichotomicum]|uniref:Cyclic-di-AMP phosphodiesterase n=1 Tax=Thermoflavimicrobium dichotomicum TaxID=46223 RepID=A0A1I3KAR5_9BACL|nr:DHH family phosphoesterase [Thermoflavimicrobium dichotomicum]SFI69606.1 c-di-AMP phosphodiesterase, consists of a GGDEF-like and DHH domains [Thermoflavimicrobium dichotomicum]